MNLHIFDFTNILYAIAAGVVLGTTFLLWLTLRFPPLVRRGPKASIVLAFLVLTILGTVFFAGQYVTSLTPEDVVAGWALWEVYSLSVGLSSAFAVSFATRT